MTESIPQPASIDSLCPGCFDDKGQTNPCPHCGFDEQRPLGPLALPLRTRLGEQFIVGRVLGKPGGFGITYLGLDLRLQTRVAIKEYLPRELATREPNGVRVIGHTPHDSSVFREGLKQFLGEARTLARLDHPNIVRVRQFFGANQTAYLVMDYYEGLSLAEYVERQGGRLSEDTARSLMLPVLDGLKAVHAQGFLHCDIKPQNIYLARLSSGGVRPILLDFGAARQAVGEHSRSMSSVVTVGYAPYEQYLRKGRQGSWTDVYAIGAVFYRLVTGEVPPEAIERREHDTLKPATDYNVSSGLSAVLSDALAVEPERRLQTVQMMQERLGVAASSKTPKPPPEPAPEPSTALRPHNTALWVTIGVLATALVGLLGVSYWQWQAGELARQREAAQMETQRLALEHEREKAARLEAERRLVELAAQQLVEQRRMQELQRQREEAESAAMAAAVREASQSAERRHREEIERREEEQRRQDAERQSAVLTTVRAYFEHVNNRRADQAMRILEASSPKTRALIENTEWVRVQELTLAESGPNRATVRIIFEGKARNAMPERYQGTIPLRWTNDGWRITTLTNLAKQ